MAGYFERRRSKAALWCRRLAVICLPFLLATIVAHRLSAISSVQAFWLFAIAIAMLIASLFLGLYAAATDLWEKGYKGGRAAVRGIVLAIVLLIPFGIQFVRAIENPRLNDVSTDVANPPQFLDNPGIAGKYEDRHAQTIVSEYPELAARRYGTSPGGVVAEVLDIMDRWNWQVEASANLPDIEQAGDGAGDNLKRDVTQEGTKPATQPNAITDALIQARVYSPIMRFPSHLMIRLAETGDSTLVDVRSASRWAPHDFGANARNISAFQKELDNRLASHKVE